MDIEIPSHLANIGEFDTAAAKLKSSGAEADDVPVVAAVCSLLRMFSNESNVPNSSSQISLLSFACHYQVEILGLHGIDNDMMRRILSLNRLLPWEPVLDVTIGRSDKHQVGPRTRLQLRVHVRKFRYSFLSKPTQKEEKKEEEEAEEGEGAGATVDLENPCVHPSDFGVLEGVGKAMVRVSKNSDSDGRLSEARESIQVWSVGPTAYELRTSVHNEISARMVEDLMRGGEQRVASLGLGVHDGTVYMSVHVRKTSQAFPPSVAACSSQTDGEETRSHVACDIRACAVASRPFAHSSIVGMVDGSLPSTYFAVSPSARGYVYIPRPLSRIEKRLQGSSARFNPY